MEYLSVVQYHLEKTPFQFYMLKRHLIVQKDWIIQEKLLPVNEVQYIWKKQNPALKTKNSCQVNKSDVWQQKEGL